MLLFTESDIFLVPFCLIVLYLLAYISRRKYVGSHLERYFFPALHLRFVFGILYASIILYYYGFGDTTMFYRALQDMHQAVNDDISLLPEILLTSKADPNSRFYTYFVYDGGYYTQLYMMNESNYAVPRLALPFSLLFGNSYLCITFCFGFFSFVGSWRIFKMFDEIYPALTRKFALGILFLPSILFWASGFLKDSLCVGALGFLVYAAYSIFMKKRKIFASLIIFIISTWILFTIKPYILIAMAFAVTVWLFISVRERIQSRGVRILASTVLTGIAVVAAYFLTQWLAASEATAQYSSGKLLETVQQQNVLTGATAGTTTNVQVTGNSFFGLIILLPVGLVTSLFRPFVWEISNPLMVFSGLEALGFLVLTIMVFRHVGFKQTFKYIFSEPILIFCFLFSIVFGSLVGISTSNFGALVRYRIPVLPFYLFLLFIVMHRSGKFSDYYIFSKRFL